MLRARGPLSRSSLARDLGLSAQSISEIIADLQADGQVESIGAGTSSGGRRPILYEVRQDRLRAVGVLVGPDRLEAVITDLSGEIYADAAVHSDLDDGPATFTASLRRVLTEVMTGHQQTELAGIGLALQTTMHRREAGVFRPSGTVVWADGVDLPAVLAPWGLPIVAENRAHAIAVGEHLFGSAQGVDDLFCLMLDQGLGGAVIAGGKLFTGGDGGAGAVGRMRLDDPASGSGSVRVTDVVGRSALVANAQEALRRARRRTLDGVWLSQIDADLVIDQALAGDQEMVAVLAGIGRRLGAAVAATLCVTDSQLVLLCGSTLRAGLLIVDPMTSELRERWPFTLPEIRLGRLGNRAAVLGAAALVLTEKIGTIERITTP